MSEIKEELLSQAKQFDQGSTLRSLLERAATHITGLEMAIAARAATGRKTPKASDET